MHLLDGLLAEGRLMDATSCVSRWWELDASMHIGQVCTAHPLQQAATAAQGVMSEAKGTSEKQHFLSSEG